MEKKIALSVIALFFSVFSFSQDLVKFIDGSQKKMKLIGEQDSKMIFKNPETQKTDTILRSNIEEIIFLNGDVLKVTKVRKNTDTTIKTKEVENEYELKNTAISVDVLTLFISKYAVVDFEIFREKSSFNFILGKGLETSNILLGADYRIYFNNPQPEKLMLGNLDLGKGFVRFLGSAGATGYFLKEVSTTEDISIPVYLGLSATITSGFYFVILGGAEYAMNFSTPSSDVYGAFKLTMGYRFNKKK